MLVTFPSLQWSFKVQQDATTGGTSLRSLPSQPQAQSYQQPPTMHPDLYRLVKMFPDFSTKTLHRIFRTTREANADIKRRSMLLVT